MKPANKTNKLKIIVLGYIIKGPLGGMAMWNLQYVLGLHKMGHDVLFVEDSDRYPACYNPEIRYSTEDPTYGLNFIEELFSRFNIKNKWAYFDFHTNQWFGKTKKQINSFAKDVDVILNFNGINHLHDWMLNIPKKILINADPVFFQIRHLIDKDLKQKAALHDAFFTYAENYDKKDCTIPKDGFHWQPTRPLVIDELWNKSSSLKNGKWTTVMQWKSHEEYTWQGKTYGMKSKSFDDFIQLPQYCSDYFELAADIDEANGEKLTSFGWNIVETLQITSTPYNYQNYIKNSKGEFGVAKHAYVITNSGWFSERSANYLANGKPVILQDTGFSKIIPCGRGLIAFKNIDQAVDAFEEVNGNYKKHCRWAQEIASDYFDYKKILNEILK